MKHSLPVKLALSLLAFLFSFVVAAQPISGVWRGKISSGKGMFAYSCKVELKLVKKGDSLYGTAYYYANTNNYMRYAVRGYFNKADNAVHWWDEKLLGYKPVGGTKVGVYTDAMVSDADFNCPGNNVMKLDGKSRIGEDGPEFVLHFDKMEKPYFNDEWDNVIEGYFTGMNDPGIIDSVYAITKPVKPDVPKDAIAQLEEQDSPAGETNPASQTAVKNKPPESAPKADTLTIVARRTPQVTSGFPSGTGSESSQSSSKPLKDSKLPEPPAVTRTTPVEVPNPGTPAKDGAIIAKNPQVNETTAPNTGIPGENSGPLIKTSSKESSPRVTQAGIPGKDSGQLITRANPQVKHNSSTIQKDTAIVRVGTSAPASNPSGDGISKTGQQAGSNTGVTTPPPTTGDDIHSAIPDLTIARNNSPIDEKTRPEIKPGDAIGSGKTPVIVQPLIIPAKVDPVAVQKFKTRLKVTQAEIPMRGDSIELNFYDNAEVDGDSISLFLNGKLLFNHVLLSAQAYTFKIDTRDLPEGSELTMVAENLGSIPPNTAFMMAVVDGQRYSARLESTEQTSGVIKLVRR